MYPPPPGQYEAHPSTNLLILSPEFQIQDTVEHWLKTGVWQGLSFEHSSFNGTPTELVERTGGTNLDIDYFTTG